MINFMLRIFFESLYFIKLWSQKCHAPEPQCDVNAVLYIVETTASRFSVGKEAASTAPLALGPKRPIDAARLMLHPRRVLKYNTRPA